MGHSTKSPELKCKIINIEPDPKHPARMLVSIEIDDGDPRGKYIRAYSLLPPENPMSLEKFSIDLGKMDLSRPVDGFHYLREAKESETEFVIYPADKTQNEE
jgi:hypothetical protein